MVFATWEDVKMFPRSAIDGTSEYQSLYYSEQQALDQVKPLLYHFVLSSLYYSNSQIHSKLL